MNETKNYIPQPEPTTQQEGHFTYKQANHLQSSKHTLVKYYSLLHHSIYSFSKKLSNIIKFNLIVQN